MVGVEAFRAGTASLDEAFRLHQPRLVRRLALVVGDAEEAKDLAQRTFVRAAERWPLPPDQDVGSWLSVVGLRLALNERRRRKVWALPPSGRRTRRGLWRWTPTSGALSTPWTGGLAPH